MAAASKVAVKSLGYGFATSAASSGTSSTPSSSASYPPATKALSAHRAVIMTGTGADYPSLANMEHGDAVLGITTAAVASGAPAAYQFEGAMMDPSWSWSAGPVFCGDAGVLVQTPPVSGLWVRQVGTAVGPNTIEINLFPAYYLRNP